MSLSQTATVLIALFTFCLVAVTAQLAYVLWWKRRFRRRSITGSEFDAFSTTATPPPSKELLYFFLFCLENKQIRIKSATAPPLPPPRNDGTSTWSMNGENNLLCGPSGTLYTISEDCTSEIDHRKGNAKPRGSISTDDQTDPRGSISMDDQTEPPRRSISTDDHTELRLTILTDDRIDPRGSILMDDRTDPRGSILSDDETDPRGSILLDDQTEPLGSISTDDEVDEEIVTTDRSDDEVEFSDYNYDRTTPFSTPCASPPFYTPSPSPIRDDRSKIT